jgi:hypothetical protein
MAILVNHGQSDWKHATTIAKEAKSSLAKQFCFNMIWKSISIYSVCTCDLNTRSGMAVLDHIYAEVDSSLVAWTESRHTCFSQYAICFSVIIVRKQNWNPIQFSWISSIILFAVLLPISFRMFFLQTLFTVKLGLLHKTPWSESASELYRPNDRRLSTKWLPNFCG